MRIRALVRDVTALAIFLTALWAADVSGKWKAEFTTPDGQSRTTTFAFQVDGAKLTGTVGSVMGEAKIDDGKVSGDEISFSVTRNFGGNDVKMLYKGKVAGEEIKFTVSVAEMDRTFEMTAKRAN